MAKNGIGGKKQVKFKMQINMRSVLIWLFVLLVILPFLTSMVGQTPPGQELTITQALEDVKEGKVESLEIDGDMLKLKYKEKNEKGENSQTRPRLKSHPQKHLPRQLLYQSFEFQRQQRNQRVRRR